MKMLKNFIRALRNKLFRETIRPVFIRTIRQELLTDKLALITGGGSGIGFAIAQGITDCGGKVILAGRSETKLRKACARLGEDKARFFVLDVSLPEEIFRQLPILFGSLNPDEKINILVNSAGMHGSGDFETVTPDEYDNVLNTNLRGTYFMSREVSKYMKENQIPGNILNISSASALKPAWSPYEISKWGIRGMTLGLARELIPFGIVVNGLAPGPTATEMLHFQTGSQLNWPANPSKRVATPEEIGSLAIHMLSDSGRYIVGDTFYITGGSGTINIDK